MKPQKSAEGIDRQSIDLVVKAVPPFPKVKGEVANWFDMVEAIMAALLLNAASKHAALTTLIGGERFALVSREAQNRREQPEATYEWLKTQVMKTYAEERTVRSLLKRLLARRLEDKESVEKFRAETETMVRDVHKIFKEASDEQLEEIIADIVIGGLPKHIRVQVKNSLADAKPTTERVERIVNNMRSEGKDQEEPRRYRPPRRKQPWKKNTTRSKQEGEKEKPGEGPECFTCHQRGHISTNCPQKKAQGKQESQSDKKKVARNNDNKLKREEKLNQTEAETHNTEVYTTNAETDLAFSRPLWTMDVTVNGHEAEILIDNGATVNLMTKELAEKLGCEIDVENDIIINKFEAKKNAIGIASAKMEPAISGKEEFIFVVVDHNHPKLILGQPGLDQMEMVIDHKKKQLRVADKWITPKIYKSSDTEIHYIDVNHALEGSEREQIEKTLEEFNDVFKPKEKYEDTGPIDFEIRLQDNQKVVEHPRRRSPWRSEIICQQVKEDLERGIIEECKETNYVSEPVLVQKSDGSWRFTVDYRKSTKRRSQTTTLCRE